MIITPARFEDAMKDAQTAWDALAVMVETLDSMGYSAGVNVWMKKFMFRSVLQGEEK